MQPLPGVPAVPLPGSPEFLQSGISRGHYYSYWLLGGLLAIVLTLLIIPLNTSQWSNHNYTMA